MNFARLSLTSFDEPSLHFKTFKQAKLEFEFSSTWFVKHRQAKSSQAWALKILDKPNSS